MSITESKHSNEFEAVCAMAQDIIRSAAAKGVFCVIIAIGSKESSKGIVLARSQNAPDFYSGLRHLIDIYEKAEKDGTCEQRNFSILEN